MAEEIVRAAIHPAIGVARLWHSDTGITPAEVGRLWQTFLRRFDPEHTFRFLKQTLGWTAPKLRDPGAADLWTWLIVAVHNQLRLARDHTPDLRRPWEKPLPANRLTPARSGAGFATYAPIPPCPPVHRNCPTRPGTTLRLEEQTSRPAS